MSQAKVSQNFMQIAIQFGTFATIKHDFAKLFGLMSQHKCFNLMQHLHLLHLKNGHH